MLTDARNAVLTLLFCAVCGLLFHFLLPEGGISRTAKILISLIVLLALCTPLFGVWQAMNRVSGEVEISAEHDQPDTARAAELYKQEAERAVCGVCETIIRKHTNVGREIEADVNISDDFTIMIEHVRITFEAQPEGREEIRTEIANECGVIPEIRVEMING